MTVSRNNGSMMISINGQEIEMKPEVREMLRATAGRDADAIRHREALATVLASAWRSGVLEPDTLGDIFTTIPLDPGTDAKFPLDFYNAADSEKDNRDAFVVPKEGAIPDRVIQGDEIHVPTYKIGNAISWSLDYARDARWDVIARAIEVFTNGFVRKLNDDGWHVIQKCAAANAVATDAAGTDGIFSKRLLTNTQTAFKRLSGGRGAKATDIYLSPEAIADIRNFDTGSAGGQIIDFGMLAQLLRGDADSGAPDLFGTKIHELRELGVGQEYESFIATTLGIAHTGSKQEYGIALDLSNRDSFVMPVRDDMEMFDDPQLHRSAKAGVYGWMELGMACLDTRRAMLLEL